jgi:hypothetical protein
VARVGSGRGIDLENNEGQQLRRSK